MTVFLEYLTYKPLLALTPSFFHQLVACQEAFNAFFQPCSLSDSAELIWSSSIHPVLFAGLLLLILFKCHPWTLHQIQNHFTLNNVPFILNYQMHWLRKWHWVLLSTLIDFILPSLSTSHWRSILTPDQRYVHLVNPISIQTDSLFFSFWMSNWQMKLTLSSFSNSNWVKRTFINWKWTRIYSLTFSSFHQNSLNC